MNTNPSKPGEGIDWTVGGYAYAQVPRWKGLRVVEITKVGRRWAEVENLGDGPSFKRFDMTNGLEDSTWPSLLWSSPAAMEQATR